VLVRQYFVEGFYPSGTKQAADALVPSGALLKAVLVNSAVDMTGVAGYPSDTEGMGRVLLDGALYFAGDTRRLAVLDDPRNAAGLLTGESTSYELDVFASTEPLEVTLAFTEPPAALNAALATVNDLDLEVLSPTGVTYRGNVFAGGASVPGGVADARNNLETVVLASPPTGVYTVRVRANAVNQGTQGFALVATGALGNDEATLRYDGHDVLDSGPLGNGDGIADPGETILLPIDLRNTLGVTATAVSAWLGSPGNASRVTDPLASYPDIPNGGLAPSQAPHHRVTVAPGTACGTILPFQLRASAAQGSRNSTFGVEVGQPGSCHPLACPGDPVPGPIGSSLRLSRSGGQLSFTWASAAGADGYRVWSSTTVGFELGQLVGATATPGLSAPLVGPHPPIEFYQVRAVNSCEWEGP
jgi:hypothetical protein